jgi:triosephosphate isomerase
MITKKLQEADSEHLSAGFELGRYCISKGVDFLILTASVNEDSRNFGDGLKFCSVDETTLKTMIRSNPGYILLKDGTIIGKWSYAGCPEKEWFGNLAR